MEDYKFTSGEIQEINEKANITYYISEEFMNFCKILSYSAQKKLVKYLNLNYADSNKFLAICNSDWQSILEEFGL